MKLRNIFSNSPKFEVNETVNWKKLKYINFIKVIVSFPPKITDFHFISMDVCYVSKDEVETYQYLTARKTIYNNSQNI